MSSIIACFDFDGTLVVPKGSSPFPKDANDWKFYIHNTKAFFAKFEALLAFNPIFVIRSDQTKPWKETMIDNVIAEIQKNLSAPIMFHKIISWDKTKTHKPDASLFQTFCKNYQATHNVKIDLSSSFHVGDAAGRKTDWSTVDKQFAHNAGLQFFTPEQFFLDSNEQCNKEESKLTPATTPVNTTTEPQIVIMCGLPAAGKSTYCKTQLPNYVYISGDVLKTAAKLKKAVKEEIKKGNTSIVVDACNGKIEQRQEYVAIAKEHNLKCKCVWIDVSKETAVAQNDKRKQEGKDHVSKIAIYTLNKNFQAPSEEEGFLLEKISH